MGPHRWDPTHAPILDEPPPHPRATPPRWPDGRPVWQVRILDHPGACPADGRTGDAIDREYLRVWAAARLRGMGADKLRLDDRLDSVHLLKRKKAD